MSTTNTTSEKMNNFMSNNTEETNGRNGVSDQSSNEAPKTEPSKSGDWLVDFFTQKDEKWFKEMAKHFTPIGSEDDQQRAKSMKHVIDNIKMGNRQVPRFDSFDDLIEENIPEPLRIIDGILGKGQKMSISAGAKEGKTWILLHLAICMASGREWLSKSVAKSRVLYANFELPKFFLKQRLEILRAHMGVSSLPGLMTWTLRGFYPDPEQFKEAILQMAEGHDFDVIIADPVYKIMNGADENAAGEIAKMLANLEEIAHRSDAAFIYAHHFSKGLQSGKESIDRSSGSGVFGRDPDTIVTLSKHSKEDCRSVELILRNYKPVDPFVVRWDSENCCYEVAEGEDPADLKTQNTGKEFTAEDAVKVFEDHNNARRSSAPISKKDFTSLADISSPTAEKALNSARLKGLLQYLGDGYYCLPGTVVVPWKREEPADKILDFLKSKKGRVKWSEIQVFAESVKLNCRMLVAYIDSLEISESIRKYPLTSTPKHPKGWEYEAIVIDEDGQAVLYGLKIMCVRRP